MRQAAWDLHFSHQLPFPPAVLITSTVFPNLKSHIPHCLNDLRQCVGSGFRIRIPDPVGFGIIILDPDPERIFNKNID